MITQQAEQGGVTAAALSEERNADSGGGEEFWQLVTCRLGREEFAIDILSVQEIIRMVEVTRVPKAPAFVEGVINLRGRIIPVLDLRQRLGMADAERTEQSRIVVVSVHSLIVGLLVDSVSEVLRIPCSTIEAPPALGSTVGAEFIRGVGRIADRLLIVLDLNRLFSPGEQAALQAA
jgi:purine-binding chemotaxis protein CheW